MRDGALATAEENRRSLRIRADTVHKVKGESLDAVLYVATKQETKLFSVSLACSLWTAYNALSLKTPHEAA